MDTDFFHREIQITEDGSHTLFVPSLNEHFHSVHGAVQESMFVFIKNALATTTELSEINILEVGFGTGLNALLALQFAHCNRVKINFTSIEKYPLTEKEFAGLNYEAVTGTSQEFLKTLHQAAWNQWITISPQFTLHKCEIDLLKISFEKNHYHICFFDAFAPDKQPELWTVDVFSKLFESLVPGGIITTYSAKGQVRRNMKSAGFLVERLPGPPGKREMLRATKPD